MLLSLHIVAIAILIGISGNIGYQMGVKEGLRISRMKSEQLLGSADNKAS